MRILDSLAKRTTLFSKLWVVLIITVSLPVSLLGYMSYERSKDQLVSVAHAFLADNVNQNAQRLQRFLQEAEQRSEAVLGSSELQALLDRPPPELITDELEFIQVMNRLIAELKGPYELYIFPKDVDQYPNYNNLLQYKQVTPTEAMFARAFELKGKGYWTHEWNRQWAAPDFMFVRQIRSLDEFEPVGVMAIRIPDFMIREELIGPSLYPSAELILTDEAGAVLSHPDAARYNQSLTKGYALEDYIHETLPLSAVSWEIAILLPSERVTASLEEVKAFTIWIVLISLLLITVLLFLIARSFTNPIKQILLYMKKVQLGRLEPLPVQQRSDEIGQWISGYNLMIFSLLEQMEATRRMEREKRELERQMLILQINPHFLYNTLDSIKWKAQALDEPVISEMVTRLANMLRFSLNDGDGWTTVERELEHVKNYVAIEQLRNPGQFRVLYHIGPDVLGEGMLQLLLQPLVENAIRHGMNKRKQKNGKIIVSAFRDEDDLMFAIEDNGPGGSGTKPGGIGLHNVQRRLQLHFGEGDRLLLEGGEQGFKVKIRHPIRARNSLKLHS